MPLNQFCGNCESEKKQSFNICHKAVFMKRLKTSQYEKVQRGFLLRQKFSDSCLKKNSRNQRV